MRQLKIISCIILFHFIVSSGVSQPFTDPCVKVSYAKALEAFELKTYSKAEKWFKVAKDCPLASKEDKNRIDAKIKECQSLILNNSSKELIPDIEMIYVEGGIFQMGKESTVL